MSIVLAYTPMGISLFEKKFGADPFCAGSGDAPFGRTPLSFRCNMKEKPEEDKNQA